MAEFLISTGASLLASILFALLASILFKPKNDDKNNVVNNFRFSVLSVIIFLLMMTYVIFNFGVFGQQVKELSSEQFLEFVDMLVAPVIRTITTLLLMTIAFLLGSGIIGKLLLGNNNNSKNSKDGDS